MEAIILAGGKGTRLKSKVSDVPKPMAPVRSRPFLEHLLSYWIDQGVSHVILSVGHLSNKIVDHFGGSFQGVPITYSVETDPLGTGGGILLALEQLKTNEPSLLLNGDSFFEVNLSEMLAFHRKKRSAFTMALSHVSHNTRYGAVTLDSEDRCVSIASDPSSGAAKDAAINGGVYVFDPEFVKRWRSPGIGTSKSPVSLEREMIPDWISRQGLIYGWTAQGRFIDIGTPEDYEKAEAFFK